MLDWSRGWAIAQQIQQNWNDLNTNYFALNIQPNSDGFVVENPSFSVSKSEKIGGKKTHAVSVSFKPIGSKPIHMGKLLVKCAEPHARNLPPWIYYLKGMV